MWGHTVSVYRSRGLSRLRDDSADALGGDRSAGAAVARGERRGELGDAQLLQHPADLVELRRLRRARRPVGEAALVGGLQLVDRAHAVAVASGCVREAVEAGGGAAQ